MALRLGELTVDIGADTSDLKRAGKEVKRTAGDMEKSFKRVGSAIVAALSFQAIKNTILLADRMNMLDARIRNVTKSAKDFRIVRQGIRDIAKETGSSIQSIATLSQNLLIASESMGATADQVVAMTSSLNKLGQIGGSSAEQMGNAMLQFGQAMAGGIVRAEEFNSIIENTPLIAQAIAKGMGMNIGALRKMVIEGKVLSEDVFKALEGQAEEINRKFAQMPLTIQRASGMIANAFAIAVQEIDNGLGITIAIAEVMQDLSEVIESDLVPGIDSMVDGFADFLFMLDQVTGSTQQAADDTFDMARSWELVNEKLSFFVQSLINLPANIRGVIIIIIGEFDKLFIRINSSVTQFTNFFAEGMTRAIESIKASFFEFIGGVRAGLSGIFEFFGADEFAESLRMSADEAKQIAVGITENEAEQMLIRQDLLDQEIESINAATDIKIQAAQMAIDAGVAETEGLKEQTAERRKIRQQERKDARDRAAGIVKSGEKIVTDDKKNKDNLNFNLSDAQKTTNALEQAGIADSRTAAIATIGISGAKAISKSSELGFPAAIPFVAQALANIAVAKDALKGGGRQAGGGVSQGVLHPVNENGQPELLVQGSKQFLLSGQSGGQIIPATSMRAGGSGGLNVTINNNAPDLVEVSEPFVTQGELMIAIERASNQAVDQVNLSLASGRGESSDSLRTGFDLTRNI